MLFELFLSFLQIGLMSIGGGYAAMPLIQAQTVTLHGWLTMGEFADLVTIAEMTPGPIGINAASFVGMRIAGVGGAVAATLGFLTAPALIVSLFALLYYRYKNLPWLKTILQCLKPVVVALIASAGIKLFLQAVFQEGAISMQNADYAALLLFGVSLFCLRKWKYHPMLILALCGAAGLMLGVAGIY